jgi:uncharacterized protein (TIGR00369 family)
MPGDERRSYCSSTNNIDKDIRWHRLKWTALRAFLAMLYSEPMSTIDQLNARGQGYLHAATVIALADTTCGYGTIADLPGGAQNFTTIELKSNFLGTAREGVISCIATIVHSGRTTQVWDAQVADEARDKTIALFRCTQLILYPRPE